MKQYISSLHQLSQKDLLDRKTFIAEREILLHMVMEEKKKRTVFLGENASITFESAFLIWFQIQEMLRIEHDAKPEEELEVYAPLVPTKEKLTFTFMLEYPNPEVRKQQLLRLKNIEAHIYLQINDQKIYAKQIDALKDASEKASAVNFLFFDLSKITTQDIQKHKPAVGCDHPSYCTQTLVSDAFFEILHKEYLE